MPVTEMPSFRKISAEFGLSPGELEARSAINFIERTTYIADGLPQVPPTEASDYKTMQLSAFQDPREFLNKIVDIFRQDTGPVPPEVYVLSEEPTSNIEGITKFAFDTFIDRIAPYILEHGDLRNYWVTDGRSATVTFHLNDVVYWKKVPPTY